MYAITIITGTSGAGKSTLKKLFEETYTDIFQVYDFDDVGVAENVDEQRRVDTTQYRLQRLRENVVLWKQSVLFGQMVPDEIEWYKDDILFIFLEAPWDTIQVRLRARWWDEDFVQSYNWWGSCIRNSVLSQQNYALIDTTQAPWRCVQELYTLITKQ